jgi:hypothetical protein
MSGSSQTPSARYIIGTVVTLAILITIVFSTRYRKSVVFLSKSAVTFKERGPALDLEGCVNEVLVWNKKCEAMKDLCDKSVPRMMKTCLTAADRKAQCSKLTFGPGFVRQYHKACGERGYKKGRVTKVCDRAYQTIGAHCQWLEQHSSVTPNP